MGARLEHDNNFNLIRLIAAFQVMAVHVLNHFELKGVFVDVLKATPGVPTFFFISGYLIGGSYQRTHHRGVGAFFRNRFLRIYPGLIACVLLATASVALTGYFRQNQVGMSQLLPWVIGQATILQFYNPDFMRSYGAGVLNGALWTITVELQFYVLVPLLYLLLKRAPRLFGAVFMASLGLNLYLHNLADGTLLWTKLLYVSFAPWLYMFLFGFLLAYQQTIAQSVRRLRFDVLLLVYIASMNFIGDYTSNAQNAINPLAFFCLACMILKVATVPLALPDRVASFLDRNDFSYGLYLYHMPVINALLFLGVFSVVTSAAMAVGLSLCAAAFSWYAVERPALRYKK